MRNRLMFSLLMSLLASLALGAKPAPKPLAQRATEVNKKLVGLVDKDWIDSVEELIKKITAPETSAPLQNNFGEGGFFESAGEDLRSLKKIYKNVKESHWEEVGPLLEKLKLRAKAELAPAGGTYTISPQVWETYAKGRSQMDAYIKLLEAEIDRLSKELTERYKKLREDLQET